MRNNDIQDEDYGKELPSSNKGTGDIPSEARVAGVIILACFVAILVALTIRVFRWITGY